MRKEHHVAFVWRLRFLGLLAFMLWGVESRAAEKWIYLKSENFEMISGEKEKYSREMLVKMEQFREAFLKRFQLRKVHEPKTLIVFFRNSRVFKPYLPERKKGEGKLAGYCLRTPFMNYIALSDTNMEESLEVILHEYVHAMIGARFPWIPLWMDEGLAQVFSTMTVEKDVVTLGRPLKESQAYLLWLFLSKNPMIPIKDFLRVDKDSDYYKNAEKMALFYAQSWGVMHYAVFGMSGRRKNIFSNFVSLTAETEISPEEMIRRATMMEPEMFLNSVRGYAVAASYRIHREEIPAGPIREKISARKASDFEVEYALMNLKFRIHNDFGTTRLRLIELQKQYPEEARLWVMQGEMYAMEENYRMAMGQWKEAVRLGSTDAFTYVLLTRAELGKYHLSPSMRLSESSSREMRAWLERAIELSPDYMEAHSLLVLVEVFSDKMRKRVVEDIIHEKFKSMSSASTKLQVLLAASVVAWRQGNPEQSLKYLKVIEETEYKSDIKDQMITLTVDQTKELARQFRTTINRQEINKKRKPLKFGGAL